MLEQAMAYVWSSPLLIILLISVSALMIWSGVVLIWFSQKPWKGTSPPRSFRVRYYTALQAGPYAVWMLGPTVFMLGVLLKQPIALWHLSMVLTQALGLVLLYISRFRPHALYYKKAFYWIEASQAPLRAAELWMDEAVRQAGTVEEPKVPILAWHMASLMAAMLSLSKKECMYIAKRGLRKMDSSQTLPRLPSRQERFQARKESLAYVVAALPCLLSQTPPPSVFIS